MKLGKLERLVWEDIERDYPSVYSTPEATLEAYASPGLGARELIKAINNFWERKGIVSC